jgi:hypothetical protein
MDLYFPEGTPANHDIVRSASLVLTPNLNEISPNTGSIGGTELTVSAPGLGASEVATLAHSNGTEVCVH